MMDYTLLIRDDLENITSAELAEALNVLPAWRREKALRFKHEQGRKECAFAYLLLCQALRNTCGIAQQPQFIIGPHGKPSLSFPSSFSYSVQGDSGTFPSSISSEGMSGELHFNLSHCKHAIACVLSSRPVGVDVECIGRYNESLARHVLNDQELETVLQASDPQMAFARYWTQKEAVVKLTGRGIDDDLKNLLVKYKEVSLHTEEHPEKGYVLTVAL